MRPRLLCHSVLAILAFLAVLSFARPARAQSAGGGDAEQVWFDADETALEERFSDGDLDEEDLARLPQFGAGVVRSGGSDVLARSWVSLVGFSRGLPSGVTDVGGVVVVGFPLDRVPQGGKPAEARMRFAEDTSPRASQRPLPAIGLALDAALARSAVRTAWRVSGIEVTDARIDDMIARSRLSVLLPEARVRVMQVFQDGQHTTSYVNSSGTVIDTTGSTTTVEGRLTWRFDRLIFAGDEPTLERVRLEREEARSRIGSRVLELLFTWQRALLDEAGTDAGSRAEVEATLRQYEAEISLDVLTGGWFCLQPAVRARRAGVPR